MNRRNFLGNLLVAAAGFSILPSATCYKRPGWVKPKSALLWRPQDYQGEWKFVHVSYEIVPGQMTLVGEHGTAIESEWTVKEGLYGALIHERLDP